MGLGLGMSMQILILIVQNSFPVTEVGTATASNNYFRQIGASLGSAIVGSLFVAKLTQLLDRADAGRRCLRQRRRELAHPGRGARPAGGDSRTSSSAPTTTR